jgi:hypothetical protein
MERASIIGESRAALIRRAITAERINADLLAALKEVLAWVDSPIPVLPIWGGRVFTDARAAIAKAEGGAQ